MKRARYSARCYRCPVIHGLHGADEACPDGGGVFQRRGGWAPATSFQPREIEWLADVFEAIEQRRPLQLARLAMRREIATVGRKVLSLRAAAVRAKADRDRAAALKAAREAT